MPRRTKELASARVAVSLHATPAEVDDSRTTLEFVLNELAQEDFGTIGIAVVHEKIKEKVGQLPANMPYFSGLTVEDNLMMLCKKDNRTKSGK